ncbi:hypothetical protein N7499_001922 [Penicillium canescens]|uniref:Uncharacterized protein n=1 Tax=Penicillium canescens TaxID=5083 RepID=A0AAD6N6L6_PENCN|nr:uncharacterized protein N7446_009456 [Penicillium canescens]KAJ6034702.1 hypothetical protein N7460_008877 [Penicillium canescens]KAJ6046365.1 hypothetical protein N7444_007619 [Penicillium canescens]KAJ6053444.1 hypothetical protein N7446_009456 [Penicillium canescens]KAJ6097548.1 hypothetical protein N7499_001922 [Penicillium canescens]KAJ6165537.1 hypothetical protein N7485_008781 [Penicillium canescens]
MEGSLALERVDAVRVWRGGMQRPRGSGKNPERIITLGLRRWSSPIIRNVPIEEQLVLGMLIGGLLVSLWSLRMEDLILIFQESSVILRAWKG